jgi:hypothetical protein
MNRTKIADQSLIVTFSKICRSYEVMGAESDWLGNPRSGLRKSVCSLIEVISKLIQTFFVMILKNIFIFSK